MAPVAIIGHVETAVDSTANRSLAGSIARHATPALAGMGLLFGGAAQAATLVVDDPGDPGVAGDGKCSLREAIAVMNAGGPATGDCPNDSTDGFGYYDTIDLDVEDISITSGDFVITKSVNIYGFEYYYDGYGTVNVGTTIDANAGSRHFTIDGSSAGIEVTLAGLELIDGSSSGSSSNTSDGGAVLVTGSSTTSYGTQLTLYDCGLSGNTADSSGGAVHAESASVHIIDSGFEQNGAFSGGALGLVDADAIIEDSNLTNNYAGGYGGSVATEGGPADPTSPQPVLTITGSTVTNSTSDSFGGGIHVDSPDATPGDDTMSVVIEDSNIENNTSFAGGGVDVDDGTVAFIESVLSGNTATGSGGGINSYGDVRLYYSDVASNSAGSDGGGIFSFEGMVGLQGGFVRDNDSSDDGGGIFIAGSPLTLEESTVSGNSADSDLNGDGDGGGIFIDDAFGVTGTACLHGSTVENNTAVNGGGIFNGDGVLCILGSTVFGNSATGDGGGAHLRGESIVVNSTVSGNQADGVGGGVFIYYNDIDNYIIDLTHTTVTNNSAPDGAGLNIFDYSSVTLNNSLVSGNNGDNCALGGSYAYIYVTGVNFADDATCTGFTNNADSDELAPLDFNGGPTQTHELCTGAGVPDASCTAANPALDAAPDDALCQDAPTDGAGGEDQRGVGRPIGSDCDVGAFEAGAVFDLSDAPSAAQSGFANDYPTLLADNGAAHVDQGSMSLRLGTGFDTEADGQPDADAGGDGIGGDDGTTTDDEDGITFTTEIEPGMTADVEVVVNNSTGGAVLNAWIDFNMDGDWDDDNEQIFTDEGLSEGSNPLTFSVPADAANGDTFARFRLYEGVTASTGITPRGVVNNGEVEDYPVTVQPPPGPTVSIDDGPSQPEGTNGATTFSFTVTLSETAGEDITVGFDTLDGTATAADDGLSPTSGTINIPAGDTSGQIDIQVNADATHEPDEDFQVQLDPNTTSGATVDSGSDTGAATIENDDAAPTVSFVAGSAVVPEGLAGTVAGFELSNPASTPVDVSFLVAVGGSADEGAACGGTVDFVINTASPVTIPAGETTAEVEGEICDDMIDEPDETVIVDITGTTAPGGTAPPDRFTGTIVDPAPPDDDEMAGGDDDDDDDCSPIEYLIFCASAASPADLAVLLPLALIGMWRRQRALRELASRPG